MKFQIKNYEDYILYKELEKAKILNKQNPIIKEEVTKIRSNADYFEFQVLDDDIYNVDIVLENNYEVTVNRCSCGSIACSHLACCYQKILADLANNVGEKVGLVENYNNELIAMARRQMPKQKPLHFLLQFMTENVQKLKGETLVFLNALITDKMVVNFDYHGKKLFTAYMEALSNEFYFDEEVFNIVKFLISNFVSAYGSYRIEMLNLTQKLFPVIYHTLSFIEDFSIRMNKHMINKCLDLMELLGLWQTAFEFVLHHAIKNHSLEYPYNDLYDFVVNNTQFCPFDISFCDDFERLVKKIYQINHNAAIYLMDYYKQYFEIDFSLLEVLENPEFYCKNYPDVVKKQLENLNEEYSFSSVSEVEKVLEVVKLFGDDYFIRFITILNSDFINTLSKKDEYLIIDNEMPFKIAHESYYNYYQGKDYLMILKPSISRNGDDLIALDKEEIKNEHIIYLDNNHQIIGTRCYVCGHSAKPCIHQSSIIHLLNNFKETEKQKETYQYINHKINENRLEAFRKLKKMDAIKRIGEYEKQLSSQTFDVLTEKADIIPNIVLNQKVNYKDIYPITFRLYHGNLSYRLYPSKFNDAMEKALDFTYGKKLHFKHVLTNFTERAQKVYNSISYSNDNDSVHFSAMRLASLILSLKEEGIELNNQLYKYAGLYPLKLRVSHNNSLEIENNDKLTGKFLITPSVDFYFENEKIYEVKYYNEHAKMIIRDILKNGSISLDDVIDTFKSNLYPYLKKQLLIDKDFAIKNNIEQLVIKAYFDYVDGNITVDFQILSNENQLDYYELDDNQKAEIKPFLSELERLGFADNQISKKEDIINFVNSNLEYLRQEATVYITNNLKKLFIDNPFKIKLIVNKKTDSILDVYFEELEYSEEELYAIYQAYKKQKNYILLNDKIINLKTKEVDDFVITVDELEMDEKHLLEHQENPIYNLFKMQKDSLEINLSEEVKLLLSDIKNYQQFEFPLNEKLMMQMRPYQLNGFKWMRLLLSKGLGCILADDMGIGKTLQTIGVIDSLKLAKPTLVICPKNIIYNWEKEINRWAPWLSSLVIVGNKKERLNLFDQVFANQINIAIASYETVRIEEAYLSDKKWGLVVLDEAQNIKNPFVERTKAVKKLQTDYKLALTGTPIENSLSDAWSIFDFIMPGYLYRYQRFVNDIEREENFHLMHKKILPFVLRRTKDEVLKELPTKTEEIIYIAFNEEEYKLYQSELLHARNLIETDPENRMRMLANITQLREICVDPRLVYQDYANCGAKTETLVEMINNLLLNGHKVLIFSQFVKYLKIVEEYLKKSGINYYMLTGDTKAQARQEMADDFNSNSDQKVFLVSLKAGGVGLNLVGADTVIHVDPWWNYAIESQASDRAYRIGQTKPVTIYKLVMKNSIEEKVIQLQEYKKRLSQEVINENDEMMTKLSIKDFEALLN